jgi:hypothetical protein
MVQYYRSESKLSGPFLIKLVSEMKLSVYWDIASLDASLRVKQELLGDRIEATSLMLCHY